MRKLKLAEGDIVNIHNIVFIKEIDCHLDSSGRKRRKALFKCHCGGLFKSIIADIFKKRTSCGCNKGNKPRIYNEGDLINGIKFIKTLGTVKYAQKAIFECPICGKHWEIYQAANTKRLSQTGTQHTLRCDLHPPCAAICDRGTSQ